MNANLALTFAPSAVRPIRRSAARTLVRVRPAASRPATLPPSAGARIETVLMGLSFVALATLAVTMEAVGAALF